MSFHDPRFTLISGVQPVLRRPSVLIRAARAGQSGWRRGPCLRRLLRCETLPAPHQVLSQLYAIEQALNAARLDGAASYDALRHVSVMIAILAEMRYQSRAATNPPPLRVVV